MEKNKIEIYIQKVKRSTLAQRNYVYGWSVDKTLSVK